MHPCLTALALAGAALLGLAAAAHAEESTTGFLDRTFKDADGNEAKYVLFVPEDYKGDKAVPLILFLHGAGETGKDGKKQSEVGIGPAIKKMEKFPAIVVFPQSQDRTWTADSKDGKRALDILAAVQKEYKVDDKRIYLTGLSMGGFGTWSFAEKFPEKWAAIVPVCGGGDPDKAKDIKDIPCWCFHGDEDKAVPVEKSRKMMEALKAAGGKPKYDEYPGVGHNSWEKAYGTKELFDWMFMQHK
jgi:predicted peptidase